VAVEALSQAEVSGLHDALRSERRARAICRGLVTVSGAEGAFFIVCRSQERRLHALVALFVRRGLAVPPEVDEQSSPASCEQGCAVALAAEEAKEELYERLLDEARAVDVATMYRQLQRAARDVQAPAFRRCLDRTRTRRARCG
jgi:hypothetical protein